VKEKIAMKSEAGWFGDNQVIDAIKFCGVNDDKTGIVSMYGGCVPEPALYALVYKETAFSPFFYQHGKSILTGKKMVDANNERILHEEYIPTLEYLFRYDRGGFWGIEAIATMFPSLRLVLNTPVLLGLLNHFLKTTTLYKIAMLISDRKRESTAMLQDVDIPFDSVQEIINWA
jgi:delta24-sterol reductase